MPRGRTLRRRRYPAALSPRSTSAGVLAVRASSSVSSSRLAAETWAILHPKRDAHSTTAKLCLRPRLRRTT